MGAYLNGQPIAQPYLNGERVNAYHNGYTVRGAPYPPLPILPPYPQPEPPYYPTDFVIAMTRGNPMKANGDLYYIYYNDNGFYLLRQSPNLRDYTTYDVGLPTTNYGSYNLNVGNFIYITNCKKLVKFDAETLTFSTVLDLPDNVDTDRSL
jgi:hypothetical protein